MVNLRAIEEKATKLGLTDGWCYWKQVQGKKIPLTVSFNPKPTDITTHRGDKLKDAISRLYQKPQLKDEISGLGQILWPERGLTALDVDDCISEEGVIHPCILGLIHKLNSYAEVSPSGQGIHIWLRRPSLQLKLPTRIKLGNCRRKIEAYSEKRFITFTGDQVPGTPTKLAQAGIACEVCRSFAGRQSPPDSTDSTGGDAGLQPALILTPDAEPPKEKFEALMKDEKFRQTWLAQRTEPEFQKADNTPDWSSYDLSLATQALRNGWSEQEVANLIIAFRGYHQANPEKALRLDYITRTLEKAKGGDGGLMEKGFYHAVILLTKTYGLTKEKVTGMESEEVLYPNLVTQGHIVVLIGKPGSGKTSLCFYEVAPKLAEQGLKVLYCDADSPALQRKEMVFFAEDHGFYFIDPYQKSIPDFMSEITKLADRRQSFRNVVLIFDTLKKYADIFTKEAVKKFFILCRKLTTLGATVILLGHANKHRGKNGELVFEGMGDVMNDADDLFYLEHKPLEGGGVECTVITDPAKGAKCRSFSFKDWSFRVTSDREVEVLDEVLTAIQHNEVEEMVINTAMEVLAGIGPNKGERITTLAEKVKGRTGVGLHRIREIIMKNAVMEGQGDAPFFYKIGPRGAKIIQLAHQAECL